MSVYKERRKRLLEASNGKDVIVALPANLFYVTDFFGSGYGVVKEDKTVLIVSMLEKLRAEKFAAETEIVVSKNWNEAWRKVSRFISGNCVVDSNEGLEKLKSLKKDQSMFLKVRRKKDEVELQRIKKASEVIDRVYRRLEKEIRPGRTEFELASYAVQEAIGNGATTNGFDAALSPFIIATGENSAFPHAELTNRKVKKKDVVLCDISLRYNGYNSDATRTFFVGSVDSEFTKYYEAVRKAQERGVQLCRVGEKCSNVSMGTRKILKDIKLEKFLTHGIGHGVGIEIHELPSISNRSRETLQENDVVTVEPGVYFAGKYGIRIEDTVIVGKKPEPLQSFTKELITL